MRKTISRVAESKQLASITDNDVVQYEIKRILLLLLCSTIESKVDGRTDGPSYTSFSGKTRVCARLYFLCKCFIIIIIIFVITRHTGSCGNIL